MKKIETWLPVFPGFYGTNFEPDEDLEIENITDQRESNNLPPLEWDAYKWDYEGYRESIGIDACLVIENDLSKYLTKIKFQAVSSPREYNFTNDSIHCEIELSRDNELNIMMFLDSHKEEFAAYIKDTYTSYDGFMSHHSNNAEDWAVITSLEHKHRLGAILQFIWYMVKADEGQNKYDAESDFHYEVSEGIELECSNHNECCNYIYCDGCSEFVSPERCIGNVCEDCFELGRISREYIVCAQCHAEIDNPWIKRSFHFRLDHHFITVDQVRCDKCALTPKPIGVSAALQISW